MSRQVPFSPMGSPAKVVSQEKLQEILARRGNRNKAGPAPSDAGFDTAVASGSLPNTLAAGGGGSHLPVSSVPRGTLEWSKPVNHGHGSAMVHDTTGRFRIDILGSKVTAHYTCWRLAEAPGALHERLGMVWSADEARRLCDDHNARQV